MARCPVLFATILECMSAVLLAAPPGEGQSPGSNTLPTPNQSLSIEEDAAKPVGQSNDPDSGKQTIDGSADGVVPKGAIPVATGVATARPPTFLGKKQSAGDADVQATGVAQTPWYRTSFGALALVLALMTILYFGLKRWAPSIRMQDGGLVRVMGRTVIGPRQSLILLRVGQRVVLVGVSPDRIDRVCEIADAEEVAALSAQASVGSSRGEFSAWLDREAAEFVDSDKTEVSGIAGNESRSGSKSLSDLLQKLRTTKI